KEMASGNQAAVEVFHGRFLGGGIEINEDVAAENDVEALHEKDPGLILKIQAIEFDVGANFVANSEEIALLRKVFVAQLRGCVTQSVFRVQTFAAFYERIIIQIRGHDFESPALEFLSDLFAHEQRKGIGFFSRGAARAPHANFLVSQFGFHGDEPGKNDLGDGVNLGLIAEEAGFSNGDFVEEAAHFSIAGGAGVQLIEIIRKRTRAENLHAALTAIGEQIELIFGLENSRGAVDKVTDLRERGITQLFGTGGLFADRNALGGHRVQLPFVVCSSIS
ncbi:MAG: hypothetical protein WBV36_21600, partial [Terriglobales bacterium]